MTHPTTVARAQNRVLPPAPSIPTVGGFALKGVPTTQLVKIREIVTTAGTQIRSQINETTVGEYADAMMHVSNRFPAIVVFHDGTQYVLADGFHRVMAAARNSFLDIEAEVRKGTKDDALRYALGANSSHGLRRTNADKRHSVELALAAWPKLSDRELARICCVDDHTVAAVRNCGTSAVDQPRVGADGKERKLPTKQPKPEPSPETEEEEDQEPEPAKPVKQAHPAECDEIEVCIADLHIAREKLEDFEVDAQTMLDVAAELSKVAKMLRKLAKEAA